MEPKDRGAICTLSALATSYYIGMRINRRRNGFSLIELLIVIAIILIIVAVYVDIADLICC